jgi:hypothetical protein
MLSFDRFVRDDDGAVTVDWVVLTSGIAILGGLALFFIQPAAFEVIFGIHDMILSYLVMLE